MRVTIDIPGFLFYAVLGWKPPDDDAGVIGLSMVAFISKDDSAHDLLPAALWHDAAYVKGSHVQKDWPRWKADRYFLDIMLGLCENDISLTIKALTLFLLVRQYGGNAWEGEQ